MLINYNKNHHHYGIHVGFDFYLFFLFVKIHLCAVLFRGKAINQMQSINQNYKYLLSKFCAILSLDCVQSIFMMNRLTELILAMWTVFCLIAMNERIGEKYFEKFNRKQHGYF